MDVYFILQTANQKFYIPHVPMMAGMSFVKKKIFRVQKIKHLIFNIWICIVVKTFVLQL